MKQPQYQPLSVAEMALSLFAVNEGFLDNVPVAKVAEFLGKEPSQKVKPPRVKEAPAHLECKYLKTVTFESVP